MKTSPVEQFVREHVTEFRRTGKKWNSRLDLYDKNGKSHYLYKNKNIL